MKTSFVAVALIVSLTSVRAAENPAAPVKDYLVEAVTGMKTATADFVKNSSDYAEFIADHGGDYAVAYSADSARIDALVEKMRENYKAIDSFGYERVEGIVAGVDSLADYDVYLDAGVPVSEGPDGVSPVVLDLGNGEKIAGQGATFTYIIEPALWAGDERWITTFNAGGKAVSLPRSDVLVAAAKDSDAKVGELLADAKAWNASVADCFGAMIVMTPTLSEYFEDWKESSFSEDKSGRFQAVSRVSDMEGIMTSCAVMYDAVQNEVAAKDPALAKATKQGFDGILAFLKLLQEREQEGTIRPAEIDELATQAREKTDKLVPQIEQGAALAGIGTAG